MFPELFRQVLEQLAHRKLRVNLYALGNISADDVASDAELAGLMRRAGYVQVSLADDRDGDIGPAADEALVGAYEEAGKRCRAAGFPERTEALSAGICIGRTGENLAARARLVTLAAHHIGSVILWPYQPLPRECRGMRLEAQNGKLFPLRRRNNATYRDYLELLGLAAVLNAKYRTRTFDFLGEGLIPELFRASIANRGWDPDGEVKGPVQLPARPPRPSVHTAEASSLSAQLEAGV